MIRSSKLTTDTHRSRPGRGHRVCLSVPLLCLSVHFLVQAIKGLLHVIHGEDTDGRALCGPSVPAEETAKLIPSWESGFKTGSVGSSHSLPSCPQLNPSISLTTGR